MKKFLSLALISLTAFPSFSQWTLLTNTYDPVISIAAYDSNIITGVGYWGPYNFGISHDHGMTWEGSNPFPASYAVNHLLLTESHIYASLSNEICRSPREEFSWTAYSEGLPTQLYLKTCIWDGLLVTISCNSVYSREEGSGSWNVICDTTPAGNLFDMDFRDGLITLAGSNGIWESQDTGATWTNWPNALFLMNAVKITGDTIIGASPGGIYRKIRSSGDITKVSDGLMTVWNPYGYEYYGEFESIYKTQNTIFVTGETGIYQLQQGVWHWDKVDGPASWVNNLADDGETLFATAGYGGTWARPLDQLIVGTPENKPESAVVKIFPNPATEWITIFYEMPALTDPVIRIFNFSGADVNIQDVEVMQNRLRINVKDLSPGLYLGKILSGNGQDLSFRFLVGY